MKLEILVCSVLMVAVSSCMEGSPEKITVSEDAPTAGVLLNPADQQSAQIPPPDLTPLPVPPPVPPVPPAPEDQSEEEVHENMLYMATNCYNSGGLEYNPAELTINNIDYAKDYTFTYDKGGDCEYNIGGLADPAVIACFKDKGVACLDRAFADGRLGVEFSGIGHADGELFVLGLGCNTINAGFNVTKDDKLHLEVDGENASIYSGEVLDCE